MRQTILNTPEDVQWLEDTHLSSRYYDGPRLAFASAVVCGNEDCPERIDLYVTAEPLVSDVPLSLYLENGVYVRR